MRDSTHDGLALELGDRWRDDARYVAGWNRWMFWDGTQWRADDTLLHMTRTRSFLREVAHRLPPEQSKDAAKLRSKEMAERVIRLARSNRAQVATVDQWDSDPDLLGTPSGVVRLSSGELLSAQPALYITKSTAVPPDPEGTRAPRWKSFLSRITDNSVDLEQFLQRWAGYCLTGYTTEHAFAFGYGPGANGKSVFLNTLAGILGDYARAIDTAMLMASRSEAHPTELARLRGVRLAIGSEVEEGHRWAESKLKRLTGGDPIPARFMRQDFFEFVPHFKLFLVGNHRPSLHSVDEAIRRRLHLVPFEVTIPREERDPDLAQKLVDEWPAIFRWMIDGCVAWRRRGLDPPDIVRRVTEDYLEAEDAVSLWLNDSAVLDPAAWESSGALFASWQRWAEAMGEHVGSQKHFTGTLLDRGFSPHRTAKQRGFTGIRLLADRDQ